MEFSKSREGDCLKVRMSGRFIFSDHPEFKKILIAIEEENIKEVHIDISALEFVDSAALGLLLLTRDKVKEKSIRLTLLKPTGQVEKMFRISKFFDIFDIVQ